MNLFNTYLEKTKEIGYVEEIVHAIAYISGIPHAMPGELVIFETGETGQILSLSDTVVEVLIFTAFSVRVGMKVARTNEFLQVPVGEEILGKTLDSLGRSLDHLVPQHTSKTMRVVDIAPSGIPGRKRIDKTFETGTAIVDLIIPLGKGQRELVIGDRKTGKTSFLLQVVLNQAAQGVICIYAAIGKKTYDIKKLQDFFVEHKVEKNVVIVASASENPPGMVFLTPYSAMTMAEYFRDAGKDVLVVMDDLTTHAKYYREIALLARRFPGRNSYPGDIFYAHARLLERAGNFSTPKGESSITCLPIVETTQGDMSGYIQTNIMSMTDGHIYFDYDLFGKGRRPAINPFLSVTRVGRQTQTTTRREISRELLSFLTLYEKMQAFVHFGAEFSESIRHTLATGDKILFFFDQTWYGMYSANLQLFLFCMLWVGIWEDKKPTQMKNDMNNIIKLYQTQPNITKYIDGFIQQAESFNSLLNTMRKNLNTMLPALGMSLPQPQAPVTAAEPVSAVLQEQMATEVPPAQNVQKKDKNKE